MLRGRVIDWVTALPIRVAGMLRPVGARLSAWFNSPLGFQILFSMTFPIQPVPGVSDSFFQAMLSRTERIEKGYLKHEDGHEMTDADLATLKKALGLDNKDKSYRPYCLNAEKGCDMPRVFLRKQGDGFQCPTCGNAFGFNLLPLPK